MSLAVDVALGNSWTVALLWEEWRDRTYLSLNDGDVATGVTVTLTLTPRDLAGIAAWAAPHQHRTLPQCRAYRTLTAVIEAAGDPECHCLRPCDVVAIGQAARALLMARRSATVEVSV